MQLNYTNTVHQLKRKYDCDSLKTFSEQAELWSALAYKKHFRFSWQGWAQKTRTYTTGKSTCSVINANVLHVSLDAQLCLQQVCICDLVCVVVIFISITPGQMFEQWCDWHFKHLKQTTMCCCIHVVMPLMCPVVGCGCSDFIRFLVYV